MYARGMTVREIQGFLREQYGTEVSPEFISSVTDEVMEEVALWQSRPLEPMYPVVFFDALRVKIREEAVVRLIRSVHELTAHRTCLLEADVLVENLNRKLRGWANYFKLGPVNKAYKAVDKYTTIRLRRWLRHKHKVRNSGRCCYPDEYLYESLGLVQLPVLTRTIPWAKA